MLVAPVRAASASSLARACAVAPLFAPPCPAPGSSARERWSPGAAQPNSRSSAQALFDRGYTFLDIRTGAEYRSGNGLHWVWLPLAEEVDGQPVMNPTFAKQFDGQFKNKMSRVIIACSDGGGRSEIACKLITDMGYSAIVTIEGGIDEYLKEARAALRRALRFSPQPVRCR